MAASSTFKKHLNLYDESWKPAHDGVMECYREADSLGLGVSYGLFLYTAMQKVVPKTFEEAKAICESAIWWYRSSQPLLAAIEASDRKGFPVEGASEFSEALQNMASRIDGLQTRASALSAFIAGEARPIGDFLDGLQSDLKGKRAG